MRCAMCPLPSKLSLVKPRNPHEPSASQNVRSYLDRNFSSIRLIPEIKILYLAVFTSGFLWLPLQQYHVFIGRIFIHKSSCVGNKKKVCLGTGLLVSTLLSVSNLPTQ